MANHYRYVMDLKLFNRISKINGVLKCSVCERKIKPDDEVVSAPRGGARHHYRIYHESCHRNIFVETSVLRKIIERINTVSGKSHAF